MRFDPFIGPSNVSASLPWDCQKTVNLFLQVDEVGGAKVPVALVGTPGLIGLKTLATSPIRALWAGGAPVTAVGGRLFAVAGSKLVEIKLNGTLVVLGDVGDDTAHSPAQIFGNGDQLFIVSAGYAYVDPGTGPQKVKLIVPLERLVITADNTKIFCANQQTPFGLADIGKYVDLTGGLNFTVVTRRIKAVVVDKKCDVGAAVTDLVIDAYNTTRIASAAQRAFLVDDVGLSINITAGAGFTVQTLKILEVIETQRVFDTAYTDLVIDSSDDTKVTSAAAAFAAGDVGKTIEISASGRQPVKTFADLVILADTTRLTSAAYPFTEADVESYLDVTAGGGFTGGVAQVLSVAANQRVDVASLADLVIDAASLYKCTSTARPFVAGDVNSSIDIVAGGKRVFRSFTGDLSIDALDATLLTSSSHWFDPADIGKSIEITAGVHFTPQTVTVNSLDDAGGAYCSNALGVAGATGGTGQEYDQAGFTAQTARITAVVGVVATVDVPLGPTLGATAGAGTLWTVGSWAQMDRAIGVAGSAAGAANQFLPGGFTAQQVKILSVAGVAATVDKPLGTKGATAGAGVEFLLATVAVVDAPAGTAGSTAGTGQLWLTTGEAELDGTAGTANATGGTGIYWEYLTACYGAMQDGYFIAVRPESRQFHVSPIVAGNGYNSLRWDPTEYGEKIGYPDHLVAALADHGYLYLLGDSTGEVHKNTGAADFPYEKVPEMSIQMGCRAPHSLRALSDTVAWLGGSPRGAPAMYRARGWAADRISTHAIEREWSRYAKISDAEAYVRLQEGHEFYTISFPTAGKTWEYDATASDQLKRPVWCERMSASGRHRARCHAYVFDAHIVGDYETGMVYEMSLEYFFDNGGSITRQRVAPHISDEDRLIYYSRFGLDMDVATGASPLCTLDWSDDGGRTWSVARPMTAGSLDYKARLFWNRLGKGRNRAFRVTSNAAVRHVWTAANLEFQKGAI